MPEEAEKGADFGIREGLVIFAHKTRRHGKKESGGLRPLPIGKLKIKFECDFQLAESDDEFEVFFHRSQCFRVFLLS